MPGFQIIIGKECTTHFEYLYIEIFLKRQKSFELYLSFDGVLNLPLIVWIWKFIDKTYYGMIDLL